MYCSVNSRWRIIVSRHQSALVATIAADAEKVDQTMLIGIVLFVQSVGKLTGLSSKSKQASTSRSVFIAVASRFSHAWRRCLLVPTRTNYQCVPHALSKYLAQNSHLVQPIVLCLTARDKRNKTDSIAELPN